MAFCLILIVLLVVVEEHGEDEFFDRSMGYQVSEDESHDRSLSYQVSEDESHDRSLSYQVSEDESHDRSLSYQVSDDETPDQSHQDSGENATASSCSRPPQVPFATVVVKIHEGTPTANYTCRFRTKNIGGTILNCNSEGKWQGKRPFCKG